MGTEPGMKYRSGGELFPKVFRVRSEVETASIEFGMFRFEPRTGLLFKGRELVVLGRRGAQLLDALLRRRGDVLTNADDDLVEVPAGPKEEAALEGPAGDLDQGTAFGDEAKGSAHTRIRRKTTPESCSP